MPISRASLDLESWSNFLPQERSDDFEYNLLLYKFKSFYNEVRDFHDLHSDCSVTRAALAQATKRAVFGSSLKNLSSLNPPLFTNNNCKISKLSNLNGKPSIGQNNNITFDVHNTVSGNIHSVGGGSSLSRYNQEQPLTQLQDIGSNVHHYVSSYNLPSLTNSTCSNSNTALSKPEIKLRNLVPNSRLLVSKSSDRLDTINNNVFPVSSNIRSDQALDDSNFSAPLPKANHTENDDNIYDAVSPDDITNSGMISQDVASSIQIFNRLSLSQRSAIGSTKNLQTADSNASVDKGSPNTSKSASSSKSPQNQRNDPDKSINSLGSSIVRDASINSTSSQSLLAGSNQQNLENCPLYANYVNIDFFLKRGTSPSFDGNDENTTNDETSEDSDADTTQMSQSLSSDQICDGSLRDMSPCELAKKLSIKETNHSSASLTPASSGDFLDETHQQSSLLRQKEVDSRSTNLFQASKQSESLPSHKSSTCFREVGNKNSPHHLTLGPIHENTTCLYPKTEANNLPSQIDPDGDTFVEAHSNMRSFLGDINLSPVDDIFEDKAQRRIVKESFAVEFCGRRKLRHLFLFNDVIVCAKYQASSKQKFTFDVKWYLNLNGVSILDLSDANNQIKYDKETIENQILAIRTNLMLLRGQMQHIKRSKHKQPSKVIKKLKKKRTELEAELVLLLPHLPLVIKHLNGKKYVFFLSSNFDRTQWIESIKFLQSQLPAVRGTLASPSSSELQAWIQTCRKNLNPSLGTFLLRSNCDDDLLYGDLYINLSALIGITKTGNYYFCFEVDSYGHFSQKASSAVLRIDNATHDLNEEYVFPLDGAHTLRVLLYEDLGLNTRPSVIGKAHAELSRACFLNSPVEKEMYFNPNCSLKTRLSYTSSELLSMRVPHIKLCTNFGMDITQVCKKEKTSVPLLIQLCINEVERRGMREVGIYRMSGTSTDVQRLKKAFETNPYVAELLLRDIDINSVTGFLKAYLREMPEGLFSNKLYLKFVSAFSMPQSDSFERTKKMLELFKMIPTTNQQTIIYLVEHLVKVNKYEAQNKMSLTNLATVLGPNILRPPTNSSTASSSDPFTTVVIGSMSQAGILYFFLNRRFCNLPLTELDSSELARSQVSGA